MNILFMCVANSARSQMAEGLAKSILGDRAWVESAGSEPKSVNPLALKAMKEIGIDISQHYSKSYDQLSPKFLAGLDYIITLCAEEVCPTIASERAQRLHWGFPDPGKGLLTEEEKLESFKKVRDDIKVEIETFAERLQDS